MNVKSLINQFKQSSPIVKLTVITLVAIWLAALAGLMIGAALILERPSQALQPTPGRGAPAIFLTPGIGSPGSSVTVRGESWPANSTVLVYLSNADQSTDYALASALVHDEAGRFTATFVIPSASPWLAPGEATVIARGSDGAISVQAPLEIVAASEEPTETPEALDTATPSPTPTSTVSPTPTATPQPGAPLAEVTTDLNVRQGPSTAYPILGLFRAGQTAEITGVSPDRGWWQIKFPGVAGERGWISARYVDAQNAGNVPVVQGPALPTPTATSTPTPRPTADVIRDWRGEYYSNPSLSGDPALVRNDAAVSFNWGAGAPAAGLPRDNYSVRWTRRLHLPAGYYYIQVKVDDGLRLWVDGKLVLDEWHDSAPTTYVAEVRLESGYHDFRVEYYERGGEAQIDLRWQRQDQTNRRPQAIPGGPYTVGEGKTISLDGSRSYDSDGYVERYEWDFNYDGYTFHLDAVGKYPAVTYPDGPAIFTIALRTIDNRGAASQVATTRVRVENRPPSAEANGPYSGQTGQSIRFTGQAADPGSVDRAGLRYRWDFGDGATADGPVANHSYSRSGTYTARLTVYDKDGGQGSDMATVQVNAVNQAPVAIIVGPGGGRVGQTLYFDGGQSHDDGHIVSYTWNFGDGSTGNGINVSHSYSQAGTYQVTLTVVDDAGAISSSTASVQISQDQNIPPQARITGPTTGLVGDLLSFSAGTSTDPDGHIVSYAWNFGDGAAAAGVDATHVYNAYGNYVVTLTVTDNDGLVGQASQTVMIDEIIQIELPPTASFVAPASGLVAESLVFDAGSSSDSDGTIAAYVWDFGDGAVESSPSTTTSHSYASPGVYTITLMVTDDDGLSDSASQQVVISEL